jgi:hypothetical protein
MNDHAGVWIDHRKAVIVGLTPDGDALCGIPHRRPRLALFNVW